MVELSANSNQMNSSFINNKKVLWIVGFCNYALKFQWLIKVLLDDSLGTNV